MIHTQRETKPSLYVRQEIGLDMPDDYMEAVLHGMRRQLAENLLRSIYNERFYTIRFREKSGRGMDAIGMPAKIITMWIDLQQVQVMDMRLPDYGAVSLMGPDWEEKKPSLWERLKKWGRS